MACRSFWSSSSGPCGARRKSLRRVPPFGKTPAAVEVSRTAALHGKELLAQGYTAGQVVQDYADISQAITELAAEHQAPVSVDEFHMLDRFLDGAIADAVASYGGLTKSRELFAKP